MATLLEIASADVESMYDTTYGQAETLTGPSGTFLAVWDNGYYASEDGTVIVESRQPMFRCRNADAVARGATVTRSAVNYTVTSVQPDGFFETLHMVQKA